MSEMMDIKLNGRFEKTPTQLLAPRFEFSREIRNFLMIKLLPSLIH